MAQESFRMNGVPVYKSSLPEISRLVEPPKNLQRPVSGQEKKKNESEQK